jgi:formiminotetrahydrofolate cyclodeaminase
VQPSSEPSFAELLAALAEQTPAPAGGCAAAWTGALAAALLEMVAGFAGEPSVEAAASGLRGQLLASAEADRNCYEPVLAAIRLPRDAPDRPARLQAALAAASQPPLAVARDAAEAAALAAGLLGALRPAVRHDAVACVLLADAAARASAELVLANLEGQPAEPERAQLEAALERAREAVAEVLGASG